MATERVEVTVDRDGVTGGLQVSIQKVDGNGAGHGYRIAGPKYSGTGENLLTHALTERDAREVRWYLDAAFPQEATDGD